MNTRSKKNLSIIFVTILAIAAITLTCFAVDRKIGEVCTVPDIEAHASYLQYYQLPCWYGSPELR